MNLKLLKWAVPALVLVGLAVALWRAEKRADRGYAAYRHEAEARAIDAGMIAADKLKVQREKKLLENKLASTEQLVQKMRKDKTWLEGALKDAMHAVPGGELGEDAQAYKVESLKKGDAASFEGVNVERGWVEAARASAEALPLCQEELFRTSGAIQGCVAGREKTQRAKRKWRTWALVATAVVAGAVTYEAVK